MFCCRVGFQEVFTKNMTYPECQAAFKAKGWGAIPLGEYCLMLGIMHYAQDTGRAVEVVHVALLNYNEPSRGLGDTIARITKVTGLDELAQFYTKLSGKPCGCASRQEALNKLVPYGVREDDSPPV